MLDYKETNSIDDIWKSKSNLRNNVKSFFFIKLDNAGIYLFKIKIGNAIFVLNTNDKTSNIFIIYM